MSVLPANEQDAESEARLMIRGGMRRKDLCSLVILLDYGMMKRGVGERHGYKISLFYEFRRGMVFDKGVESQSIRPHTHLGVQFIRLRCVGLFTQNQIAK